MVGRRWSLASVASGAEDLLSRLIGMRLLSESRVTQRGSFLMRGGAVHPVDALGDGFYPHFLHSKLRWKFLLGDTGAWVEMG